ncbi:MAG TPA: adenosine monophosphate-protein transferase [Candidatus Syntrophoarchaeum butanivorans]|uniref:Adenosine monophosphate-protein transferase n=1 Tax=Candidatus Syntropharchaeum butanivorans TaxID=1839936 RepID=A0A7C0X3U5_9EURY|nr:adenosine monophosphate-protein transferase [Candidatus Syntrophoarchaeum butanivorans]
MVELDVVRLENPDGRYQVVVGQGNFTVLACDDIFRLLLTTVPGIKCAVGMNEADSRLTRVTGNDETLRDLAGRNASMIGAGHVFVIMIDGAFPINVLGALKAHPAVVSLYLATANPVEVITAKTELGCAVLGVVDGASAIRIESDAERDERRKLCEALGYRLE